MDIIDLLPPEYNQAVGNVSLPQDDGLALAECLSSRQTTRAWNNGTVKHGDGAHAYAQTTRSDDPQERLEGSSMTPGDQKTIFSLRTEHYGAFGIALIGHTICIRHSITATTGYINFYIDNDTVIKRLKYGVLPEMGSEKHCKTDYLVRYMG